MSLSTNLEFSPIQCTSKVFENLEPQNGFLYFLTDTKQIFLGKNNEFIDMCGGVNIYYGTKEIIYENSGQAPNPNVVFQLSHLEGTNNSPLRNDLILNQDGCFYKVLTVDPEGINTVRLTLQGNSIGGGGGGTSTGGSSSYSLNVSSEKYIFSSEDEKMEICFYGISETQTENYFTSASFTISTPADASNEPFCTFNGPYYIGTLSNKQTYYLDLSEYKHLFGNKATTVYINTIDAFGASRSKSFIIQVIDLQLKQEENVILSSPQNTYKYSFGADGAKTGLQDIQLVFSFYNVDTPDVQIIEPKAVSLPNNYVGDGQQVDLDLTSLPHGVYNIQVQLFAKITGTAVSLHSNILQHKLIRLKESSNLLAIEFPNTAEQYTNTNLYYYLASNDNEKTYTFTIKVNNELITSESFKTNTLYSYPIYFEEKGIHTVVTNINELGNMERMFEVNVIAYNGFIPVIDPSNGSMMLYLSPKGQSNNSTNRNIWYDYTKHYPAILTDMYYGSGNGWSQDLDGTPYLNLTSGGKLSIPNFYPFAEDPTKKSATNSAMGSGMTIELDFEISGVTDYNAELIKCISKTEVNSAIAVGFSITGKTAKFYNNNKNGYDGKSALTSIPLNENKRIRLSFVIEPNKYNPDKQTEKYYPMLLTYLNGIISNAVIYDEVNDKFVDNLFEQAVLTMDSTHAQIKIYGIRFYSTALKPRNILNNYTASLPTLAEKEKRAYSNDVYDSENNISYKEVSADDYDLQIPYMTIVGGWKTDKDNDKWRLLEADKIGAPGLPEDKKDYRLINVSVKYPKTELFQGYKDYSFKNIFSDNSTDFTQNFGNAPVNKTGCIMYCQGTSSMEYPVKNLRIRFRNKNDYFTVKPNIKEVEIICMKADYMESSGSHNTGAANLIDELYKGPNLKTPGQKYFEQDPNNKEIVTCIKGHPCLIFYSPTGEPDSFEYIGKYNLNLDKATPEPFGFNHADDFGYLAPGDEYWKIQYADKKKGYADPFIGQAEPDEGADYVPNQIEEKAEVQKGEKINSIHCFEFLDNAVPVCNFLRKKKGKDDPEPKETEYFVELDTSVKANSYAPGAYYLYDNATGEYVIDNSEEFDDSKQYYSKFYNYHETWYGTFKNADGDLTPGWTLGFESRYPEDRVGYHDADMLYPLASWISELYYSKQEAEKTNNEQALAAINKKFVDEYQNYFDKDYLLFYYVVTEALLMADSRVKNMMIATWGKETRTFEDSDKVSHTITDYIWYPIFYDMDTMLGLDNTGVLRFKYYDEDTTPTIFNGEEVLWNFVRDNLTQEISKTYNQLESAGLHIDKGQNGDWDSSGIIPYFNNNQANLANEAFYNGDAQYKYIRPAVKGYWDGLNEEEIAPGKAPYLYAAQGDRSLNREYFITNRIKFLRGKYQSSKFKTNDIIEFRWYFPKGTEDEFKEYVSGSSEPIDHFLSTDPDVGVQPSGAFTLKALQTGYSGILLGKNGNVDKAKFTETETEQTLLVAADYANGTECYILGVSNLKDLGDLSNKYLQKFVMKTNNKLQTLKLGNGNKNYYNPYWKTSEAEDGDSFLIDVSGCSYLKEFNLQNCKTYTNSLNFSNCPAIETILLTGSKPSSLTLPTNGKIKELRIPTSITSLNLISQPYLEKEGFTIGYYDYGDDLTIAEYNSETKEMVGNPTGHYVNDYINLQEVCIVDTPIDSYDLVSKAVGLNNYCFEGFTWEITGASKDTQYVKTKDLEYNPSKTYYVWSNENLAYKKINSAAEFNSLSVNSIKEEVTLKQGNNLVNIPILDCLSTKLGYKNNSRIEQASALKGTIKIAVPNVKVNQFELYKKYNRIYPNVKLEYDVDVIGSSNITPAYTIQFFNTPGVTEQTEPYYTVLTDGNYTFNQLITKSDDDGPAGADMPTPTMPSTSTEDYVFTRTWKDVDTGDIYDMDVHFNNKPNKNLRLEAVYNIVTRTYPVHFYNHLGVLQTTVNYSYRQKMIDNNKTPLYLGRDNSDIEAENPYNRYTFKGWITKTEFDNQVDRPEIIDVETKEVVSQMYLYPYYVIEDCRYVSTDLKYFDISSTNKLEYREYVTSPEGNVVEVPISITGNFLIISIKENYKQWLSGKITLPSVNDKGIPINIVGNFAGNKIISEVYFLEGNSYISIGEKSGNYGFWNAGVRKIYFPPKSPQFKYLISNCFYFCSSLREIENLPNSIEYISPTCFYGCNSLELDKLPDNLKHIGSKAFYGCTKVSFSKIPLGVETINAGVFINCPNVNISQFGKMIDQSEMTALENNLIYIHSQAFEGCGDSVTNMFLNSSIKFLGSNAFKDYGTDQLILHDTSGIINNSNVSNFFGSTNVTIS